MANIRAGHIYAFYLFDIAESVNLTAIQALVGRPVIAARLAPKSPTPAYVQYENPPLSFEGDVFGITEVEGFRARFRFYDYGVISLALSKPFNGPWRSLVSLAQELIDNGDLERVAEERCRAVVTRVAPTLTGFRNEFLSEDYLVFAVNELDPPLPAEQLIAEHGDEIAAMLRGERHALSAQEKTRVLRRRLSYLVDDVVVATWNAALVYDTPSGTAAALEIIEFANSQLLEFRYYDHLLDQQLAVSYAGLQRPRWSDRWIGLRYRRAARQVQASFIDVSELTDKTQNALKFIGDLYAVRLFGLVADRVGLGKWKASVQSKLKTLDDIYRFAVEESSMSRGEFLELTIVLILILELVLILLGVME